jgi:hypothetical protein
MIFTRGVKSCTPAGSLIFIPVKINIQYAKTDLFFPLLQALVLVHLHGGGAHHV